VCQDILQTETTAAAHIILPGAAVAEKEGTFTNMEGCLQQFSPAILPPGDSRPDFEILSELSQKMSGSPHSLSLDDIREEISRVLPMYTGNTQSSHLVWIKDFVQKDEARAEKPDSSIEPKFSDVFPLKRDTPDSEYPLTALLGSDRYHLGCGTRTSRSYRISTFESSAKIEPEKRSQPPQSLKYPDSRGGELQISIADANRLALKDGDAVRLISKWGEISRSVRIQKRLSQGLVYVQGAYSNNDARCLIPLTPLFSEESSGWNYCRVKMEII
ncbi:MAG: molybdopterin-dependent oxidoreductase, partial [Pseudomonadota bacterium]